MIEDKNVSTFLLDSIRDQRVWLDMKSKLRSTNSNTSTQTLDLTLFEYSPGTLLEMSRDMRWTLHKY